MSEIKGTGLSTSTPLPTEISVSDFGGLTPAQYAAVMAEAFNAEQPHEVAQLSSTTLGATVSFSGIDWIVVDVLGQIATLVVKDSSNCRLTTIGVTVSISPTITSLGEGLYKAYSQMDNALLTVQAKKCCAKTLSHDGSNSGNPTLSYTFAPTRANIEGGYAYFATDETRAFDVQYWTTTNANSPSAFYGCKTDGTFATLYNSDITTYFRPFINVYIA